jgi:hypothetical protein
LSDEIAGLPLADALSSLLGGFDRNRGPVSLQNLLDAAQRRGRLPDGIGPAALLAAARCDNLRRETEGKLPRFRIVGNRIALTEWSVDSDFLRLDKDLTALSERMREVARRTLLRKLQELPPRALGELIVALLERLGATELTPVRRTGAHSAELHVSAKVGGAAGEIRTAIVVRRDGREIGRERVTELRGALHHYGPAHAGWLVTTGQVLSGAREEAASPGAAPVSLVDGNTLARLCEQHGIGVVVTRIRVPLPDLELLEALRSS